MIPYLFVVAEICGEPPGAGLSPRGLPLPQVQPLQGEVRLLALVRRQAVCVSIEPLCGSKLADGRRRQSKKRWLLSSMLKLL